MSLGGGALAQCNGWFVGPAFLVGSFVCHPFRKERGKDGAPGKILLLDDILRKHSNVECHYEPFDWARKPSTNGR